MSSTEDSRMSCDSECSARLSPSQAVGEQIPPLENAQYDDNSRDCNDGFLTSNMLKEEHELAQKNIEMEAQLIDEAEEANNEQKFKMLHHLLNKSQFYTEFLREKIQQQQVKEPTVEASSLPSSQTSASLNVSQTSISSGHSQTSVPTSSQTKRSKKRKKPEPINLLDYLDEGELAKKPKLVNGGTKSGTSESDRPKLQPKLLVGGTLRDYQLDGFQWLKILFENGVNGILADEMGLGKTIQCIALFAHLIEMGIPGPFLICAPLSTVPNWVAEFRKFTPKIPVVLYHGSKAERLTLLRQLRKKQNVGDVTAFPVVVTSYEIIIRDSKELHNMKWKYIVIDEGHRIKNFKCLLFRELKRYHSANRLLLTGTPLQNNLSELWSLLNFLIPEIFDNLEVFESWFNVKSLGDSGSDEKIIAQEQENQLLSTLHKILSPFLLRRMKCDVDIQLPPKKELLVYAPLTELQEQYYRKVVDKTIKEFCEKKSSKSKEDLSVYKSNEKHVTRSKTVGDRKKLAVKRDSESFLESAETCINVKNIVMALRKCCNHPYLLSYPLDPATNDYLMDEELVNSSGKMMLLDAMLPKLKKGGHKILLFSQMTKMLDIVQDYCTLRNYKFSRLDGSMSMDDRFDNIDQFNGDSDVFIFLLSTRSGGLGLNLIAADTVIIYDSDWNPQCDLQAMDRCHRIGQKKPVVIYRLITSNTIDQKIVERAANKRKLEKMIMYKGKFKQDASSTRTVLDMKELLEMLKTTDYNRVVRANKSIDSSKIGLTDKVLDEMLDRSDMMKSSTKSNEGSALKKNSYFKVISEELVSDGLQLNDITASD